MFMHMIMLLFICYNFITYEASEWFTLTFITSLTPCLIFTIINFSTNHFLCVKVYRINIVSKNCSIKMSERNFV